MGIIPLIIIIFTVLANVLIILVAWINNPKSWTNRLLIFLSTIMALWTVTNFLAISPGTDLESLFWVRAVMFVTSPIGAATYLLALNFPSDKYIVSKKISWLVLTTTGLGMLLSPTMFSSLKHLPTGGFSLVPSITVIIFAFNHFGYTIAGLVSLIKKHKASRGILKRQLFFVLIGLLLTLFFITTTNFVAVVVFRTIEYTFIGPVTTLFQVGFVAYAIIRHRLFDVRGVIARAVSYILLLATVVFIEVTILYLGTNLFVLPIDDTIITLIGATLIIVSYPTIRGYLNHFTDRIFFQGRYDQEDLLKALTTIMVREANIRSLTRKLSSTLTEQMRLTTAEFILITDNIFAKDTALQTLFHASNSPLVFEELESDNLKEVMRQKDITLTIPLRVQKDKIGLLILGPKASGDLYADRDLETLEIFAPQAAIAIQNAQHLDEIEAFNKTLEAKVDERTRELKLSQSQALKLKDEFVFIATHDLATPVTAITGFMAMIKDRKEKMSASLRDDLSSIADASARLKILVNDLLQVARSDSGTITVSVQPLSVKPVLAQIVEELSPQATEHQVDVTLKILSSLRIMADPKKFAEIAENLVSNGIKYNKQGGKLSITAEEDARYITLIFKDTGLGIPKSEQGEVFSKFYRSSKPEVRQKPGTGLGLFVVRMLTQKMRGKISFESIDGIGTTFYLSFLKA